MLPFSNRNFGNAHLSSERSLRETGFLAENGNL